MPVAQGEDDGTGIGCRGVFFAAFPTRSSMRLTAQSVSETAATRLGVSAAPRSARADSVRTLPATESHATASNERILNALSLNRVVCRNFIPIKVPRATSTRPLTLLASRIYTRVGNEVIRWRVRRTRNNAAKVTNRSSTVKASQRRLRTRILDFEFTVRRRHLARRR